MPAMAPRRVEGAGAPVAGAGATGLFGPLLSWNAVLFALGLAISLFMLARSQVGGDQLDMLGRGWLFTHGDWVQFGMTTSADGKTPGGLTSLLAGVPLLLWRDYRAPALASLLAHVLAYFLLDRTLRGILTPTERLLFAVLYWLNPWRLYHSAFVWNSNWVFLFGAIQMWAVYRQRTRPSFWISLLHALALGAYFQVHSAFVILVLASVFLWARGYFKPSWPGIALGAGLSVLALIPWVLAAAANPALVPGTKGFPLRGLILVFPFLRGLLYWLRYPSLSFGGTMTSFDFSAILGREDRVLGPLLENVAAAVGLASVFVSLLAAIWMWRRNRRRWRISGKSVSGRLWLHGYVVWTFAATAASFALSPTTAMQWQGFTVVHAAVLPLVMWTAALLRSRRKVTVRRLARVHLAWTLVLVVCMSLGSPMYRRGGRDTPALALLHDHPMLHELGILEHTGVTAGTGTWTPDVFLANPAEGR